MTRSVILSGGGAYRDPWHPFATTSVRLAEILRDLDHDVDIAEDVADRLTGLDGVDLIVVNAADGPRQPLAAARSGLLRYLGRGGAVLAVHVGVSTLLGLPEWESVTGAAWVAGTSTHPPLGPSHVILCAEPAGNRHAIVGPLGDFDLIDERYSFMRTAPDNIVLARHEYRGIAHPLVWARRAGPARVVSDTLGHDGESYDSPDHRRLIARCVDWLTGSLDEQLRPA